MRLTVPAAAVLLALAVAAAGPGDDVKPKTAPKLPQKEWLNTPDNKPLRIEQLRGKVVLVQFLTYG